MKKRDKHGQFYLVASIILAVILATLAVTFNYSIKSDSSGIDKITRELRIESEKVLDYEAANPGTPTNEFDDFSKKYSYYAGTNKDIYFILVDTDSGIEEAYKYTGETKVDLSEDYLTVAGDDLLFAVDEEDYGFELEKGKNFYFVVVYDTGDERYVSTG